MIYLSPPDMTDAERKALLAAFDSGWVAPVGPDLSAFEDEMCEYLGLPRGSAVALSSGTAALHLALLLVGVRDGDEVWTSTLTFAATANAITYVGATPVFVDVDPATWQLDPEVLRIALEQAAEQGRLPTAVVTVDLYGQTCDYDAIVGLCETYGIAVVEDAAEALGATYRDRPAATLGEVGVLSFNGNKLITTGGGGMLISADRERVDRARYLSTQARQPVPHYEHTEVGYNYRLSNLLAAIGRAQLGRVDDMIDRRRYVRRLYEDALGGGEGVSFMPIADYGTVNNWLSCLLLDPYLADPAVVSAQMNEEGVEARRLWKPMHAQPMFADNRVLSAEDPEGSGSSETVADRLFATGMCLPSGSTLEPGDVAVVIDCFSRVLGRTG